MKWYILILFSLEFMQKAVREQQKMMHCMGNLQRIEQENHQLKNQNRFLLGKRIKLRFFKCISEVNYFFFMISPFSENIHKTRFYIYICIYVFTCFLLWSNSVVRKILFCVLLNNLL